MKLIQYGLTRFQGGWLTILTTQLQTGEQEGLFPPGPAGSGLSLS